MKSAARLLSGLCSPRSPPVAAAADTGRRPPAKPDLAKGQATPPRSARLPHHRRLARQPGQPDPAGPAPGVPGQAAGRVQDRQARQPDHEGLGGRADRAGHEERRRVLRDQAGQARLREEQGPGRAGREDLPRRPGRPRRSPPAPAATAPTAPASRRSTRAWPASMPTTPRRSWWRSAAARATTAPQMTGIAAEDERPGNQGGGRLHRRPALNPRDRRSRRKAGLCTGLVAFGAPRARLG